MALTEVSIKRGNRWDKTEPDEVWSIYRRTVSAKERLLRCDFCGQYVTFAVGNKNVNHFRHNSNEDNKECEERTKYNKDYYGSSRKILVTKVEKHNLPLKLIIKSSHQIELEIGMIPIPEELESKLYGSNITIDCLSTGLSPFQYSFVDRINNEFTTYLKVGSVPSEKYSIKVSPSCDGLDVYWPKEIEGIPVTGCLFNETSGKKIPFNANVRVGKRYLLLVGNKPINKANNSFYSDINIEKVCESKSLDSRWYVYRVWANEPTQTNKEFFRLFNANLTDESLDVNQIWPACNRTSESICHYTNKLYFYTSGDNITIKSSPETHIEREKQDKNNLIIVETNRTSQMLVLWNNFEISDYKSLIYKEPKYSDENYSLKVTDENNNNIISGIYNRLPKNSILYVDSEIDGKILVYNKNILCYKSEFKAGKLQTPKLIFGNTLCIYQGMDCVCKISFEKNSLQNESTDYKYFIDRLNKCKGKEILIDHSFGSIIRYFNNNQLIKNWLIKIIHTGSIKEDALKIIKSFCLSRKFD